jgi:hypothetical protein
MTPEEARSDELQRLQIEKARRDLETGGKGADTPDARAAHAQRFGMSPTDPGYKSYVLTGKMPREDQSPLTATDKKAILEADEAVRDNTSVIKSLENASKISPNAYDGASAGVRSWLGNNLPDALVPDFIASKAQSEATTNLDNILTQNALTQLKSVFGGNPSNAEREILLAIQGASSKPEKVRQDIYNRAREMAAARLEFNKQRANDLRGGEYYKQAPRTMPEQQPVAPTQPGPQLPEGWKIQRVQ